MEPLRPNHRPYGRTKANAPCRKHPKHIQSPGVCSLCLNKKLSQLTNASSSSRRSRAVKSSPSLSSSSSSSYISSLSSSDDSYYSSHARARKPTRVLFKNLGQETLKKSRSMVFFLQRRNEESESDGRSGEMKRGFWSRMLLLPRKDKALTHSRTTRERATAAV